MVQKAIREVYEQERSEGDIHTEVVEGTAKALLEAEFKGFGNDFNGIEYGSIDHAALVELRYNVYVFSAFKNHAFIGDLVKGLVDDDGNIRSFADFKAGASRLEEDYYLHWLDAEYQTAVSTGQMAARWQEFQKDADILPFLQYQTVGDERVREDHKPLDGATYPIDHEFWDVYFPPNGWRCRCDVIQVAGPLREAETTPELPPSFTHNPGSTKRIATENHPYFNQIDEDQKASLKGMVAEFANRPPRLATQLKKEGVSLDPTFWRVVRAKAQYSFRKNVRSSHYDFVDNRVTIRNSYRWDFGDVYKQKVLYHEFGHAAHIQRGLITPSTVDADLLASFKKCQKELEGINLAQVDKQIRDMLEVLQNKAGAWEYRGMNKYDWIELLGATADTLEALTKGRWGYGHGAKYYRGEARKHFDKMEWFAHASEFRYMGNPIMQELLPTVYDTMIQYIRTIE